MNSLRYIFIILFSLIGTYLFSSEQKEHEKQYLESHSRIHRDLVTEIQIYQREGYVISETQRKENFEARIKKINNYKQNSLSDLRIVAELSYKEWNAVKAFIAKAIEACNNYNYCALADAKHSLSDGNILKIIIDTFNEYNFCPYRVSIIDLSANATTHNNFFHTKPPLPVITEELLPSRKKPSLIIYSDKIFEPGIVALHCNAISNLPTSCQRAVCLQAVQTVIAQDAITPHILQKYLAVKFPHSYNKLIQTDIFKTIQNVFSYTFPILLPAFKDRYYALKMYHYFLNNPDSNFRSWGLLCYLQLQWMLDRNKNAS